MSNQLPQRIRALMDTSGVRFGTSGARGPVRVMMFWTRWTSLKASVNSSYGVLWEQKNGVKQQQ